MITKFYSKMMPYGNARKASTPEHQGEGTAIKQHALQHASEDWRHGNCPSTMTSNIASNNLIEIQHTRKSNLVKHTVWWFLVYSRVPQLSLESIFRTFSSSSPLKILQSSLLSHRGSSHLLTCCHYSLYPPQIPVNCITPHRPLVSSWGTKFSKEASQRKLYFDEV